MEKIKNIRRGKGSGFSLVEVLMVAVIFSIIGIGIAGSFISGVKIWRRSQDMSRVYSELILTLEKISGEVRQSVNITAIGFEAASEGDAREFSFPALIRSSIVKITYRFDPQEKKLYRGQVQYKDIIAGNQKDKYTEKEVIRLDELKMDYYFYNKESNTSEWRESWKKEDGIFRLVRLIGKYNGEEFTKIILVPIL